MNKPTDFVTLTALVEDKPLERELERVQSLREQIRKLQFELELVETLAEFLANEILHDIPEVAYDYAHEDCSVHWPVRTLSMADARRE